MKDIFDKTMELSSLMTKLVGGCDIIQIDVSSAMKQLNESDKLKENSRVKAMFFSERYFELVDDLVKYGIIKKDWES